MFGLGNWIKESVSSGGTGNLTLGGAETGYIEFYKWFGDATTNTPYHYFRYVISDGNDWESGVGHMSATSTLVRDLIETKVASGTVSRFPASGLTVSTSAFVFCDVTAEGAELPYIMNASSASHGVPTYLGSNGSTETLSANYLFGWPFFLPLPGVYTGLLDQVQTTAGTGYDWAIYSVGTDGKPDQLLAKCTGMTPTSGINQRSFDGSATPYLSRQWYWQIWSGDGAMVFKTPYYQGAGYSYGSAGIDTSGLPMRVRQGGFYGTSWPQSFSSLSPTYANNSQDQVPAITLTRSA